MITDKIVVKMIQHAKRTREGTCYLRGMHDVRDAESFLANDRSGHLVVWFMGQRKLKHSRKFENLMYRIGDIGSILSYRRKIKKDRGRCDRLEKFILEFGRPIHAFCYCCELKQQLPEMEVLVSQITIVHEAFRRI